MKPRVINYLRHDLSSRQALAIALDCWAESRKHPVLLIAPDGQAEAIAKTIRVAFSKEKHRLVKQVHYGFTLSPSWPYTEAGIRGEAITLKWRMTPRQHLANSNLFSDIKETINHG